MIKLLFLFLIFIFLGCQNNQTSNQNNDSFLIHNTESNDTDNDGLADKYEDALGLSVGVKDADSVVSDPLLQYQWHLINQEIAPHVNNNILVQNEDINIAPVWKDTIGEKNITVSIVDTGIDSKHQDLDIDTDKSYRYSDDTNDPSPTNIQLYNNNEGSAHGTACAGLVAAKGWNSIGTRGVAPNINIAGLNVFSNPTDASFADALQRMDIDVSSNSWGGGGAHWLFDDITSLEAIENGVINGRDKKGIVYIFASGNDGANANFQSILASGYVIPVSAVDGAGKIADYSDFGANILVSAPGGDADTDTRPALITTDLSGLTNGMDTYKKHWEVSANESGDFTHAMNGTSAACPIVAGIAGLMLSVNANLTYRDIQYILATTARKNDSEDNSWFQNGADYSVSDKYGFGVVDAAKAVEKSRNFSSLVNEKFFNKEYAVNIAVDTPKTVILDMDVEESFSVLQAQILIDSDHDNPGKLQIILESPMGTKSTLAYGDTLLYDKYEPWTLMTFQMLNEDSNGKWRLHITDLGSGNHGNLLKYSLTIKGY